EDVGEDDEAPDAHDQGGVEEVHDEPDSEGSEREASEPRSGEEGERTRERGGRSRRRGRRGGRRGRERNGERGGEAQAQNGGSEPHVGDEQPSYYAAAEGEAPPHGEATSGHREAIVDFPALHADGNEVLPAKEVRRPRHEAHPVKEASAAVAEAEPSAAPAPRRRTGSSEPRVERIVVGQSQGEAVTEDTSASSAPVRKGWWQRKLGGE
ncbi:MAG: hypothetical protein Q8K85_20650, partial [Hyphomicrobium sp.]|nr:hypothetical protein [Hyphomicrobium sp.]